MSQLDIVSENGRCVVTDNAKHAMRARKASMRARMAEMEKTIERQNRLILFYRAEHRELTARIRELMRPNPSAWEASE